MKFCFFDDFSFLSKYRFSIDGLNLNREIIQRFEISKFYKFLTKKRLGDCKTVIRIISAVHSEKLRGLRLTLFPVYTLFPYTLRADFFFISLETKPLNILTQTQDFLFSLLDHF